MSRKQNAAKGISQLEDEPHDARAGADSAAKAPLRADSSKRLLSLSNLLSDNEEQYRQRAGGRYIAPADLSGPPSQPASAYEAKIYNLSRLLRRPAGRAGRADADIARSRPGAPEDRAGQDKAGEEANRAPVSATVIPLEAVDASVQGATPGDVPAAGERRHAEEDRAAPAASQPGESANEGSAGSPPMSMTLQLAYPGWPKRNGSARRSAGSAPAATAGTPASAPAAAVPDTAASAAGEPASKAVEEPSGRAQAKAERSAEVKEKRSPEVQEPIITAKPTPEPKPVAKPGGGGGGGSSGGDGGGGGGGGGGGPVPMQQRYFDPDFRLVLSKGLAYCRRNMVIVGLFSFVLNILILAIPIYLFQIADRVLTSRSVDTLIMLTIVVCGALLAHALLDMMRRYMLMRVAVDVETKLGAPVLSAAAQASHSGSSREFQSLGDLQHLRSFLTGPTLLTMFDAPVAPLFMVVVFLIHPQLGLILLFAALALLVIAMINQKLTAVPFAHANAYNVRANLQADAMARNCQVINAMGMIPEAVLMWGRETAESLKAQVRAQDRNIFMTGVSKVIRLFAQVAILGWGAWLAINGELTGGMIIAASIIGSRALAPIEGTIEGWRNFVQARSAYERIRMLLFNSPLNLERLRLPRPQGRLAVERVLFVPPPTKKVILNGVNFELEPGQSLAIIGPSGSGKSTLARMIVGAIAPTAGNVRLDMMDLRNWDPRQFGESVGYLPQDVQLFPASIKANIARMRDDVTDEMIFDAAELADVHEMISQFAQGYETVVAMDGSPLSGGQKQRIGLARAFFGNPRLVVLDEPNSNLDVPGERALARAMQRARERGITAVVITQRPELLKSVDLVLMLKEGTVQAFGERDEMLRLLSGARPSSSGSESNGHGSPGNGGYGGNGFEPNGGETPPDQT